MILDPGVTNLLGSCDSVVLEVLELLGVDLPLGVVGLAMVFESKFCLGHWLRQEGTHATGWAVFLGA